MAAANHTGSTYTGSSMPNRTGIALSTMVIIKVGGVAVGAIQKIDLDETRTIKMFSEVGTDGAIDSSPVASTVHSGTCERLRYDGVRLLEAFGCGFLHLKSMRIPIDIEIIDRYTSNASATYEGTDGSVVTTLQNVWFKNLKFSYTTDNWQVSESATFDFETIYSRVQGATGDITAATGGVRSLKTFADPYEITSDIGGRRGAMDAPGLLYAAYTAPAA